MTGVKPLPPGERDRVVDERELEQRADAGEVVEAAAADLGAALDVDRAEDLADLDVVADGDALGREVAAYAGLLDDGEVVLAADGSVLVDQVGQLRQQGRGLGVGGRATGLGGLHALGEVGRARHGGVELALDLGAVVVGRLLEPALDVPDVLGLQVLLAAQRAERRLGRAAHLVGVEELVDDAGVLPAPALALAHTVRVVSKELQVDHTRSLRGTATRNPVRVARPRRCVVPGCGGDGWIRASEGV